MRSVKKQGNLITSICNVFSMCVLITSCFSSGVYADPVKAQKAYDNKDFDTAFDEYLKDVKAGDTNSWPIFESLFIFGYGSIEAAMEAKNIITRSAEKDDVNSQYMLAQYYGKRLGKENQAASFHWYLKAANLGHVEAQHVVSVKYEKGTNGVGLNIEKSIFWLTKAAENKDKEAQSQLGSKFIMGNGVEKDVHKAIHWHKRAANNGMIKSNYMIGQIYVLRLVNTESGSADYKEAYNWFLKGAELGDVDSQFQVAELYFNGKGVTQDTGQAIKWYIASSRQNYAKSHYALGYLYSRRTGFTVDEKKSHEHFLAGAKLGYAMSQNELAVIYRLGIGVPRDIRQAEYWFLKAAEQGFTHSQYVLGNFYSSGKDVEPNPTKAKKWFKLAADGGHAKAKTALEKFQ